MLLFVCLLILCLCTAFWCCIFSSSFFPALWSLEFFIVYFQSICLFYTVPLFFMPVFLYLCWVFFTSGTLFFFSFFSSLTFLPSDDAVTIDFRTFFFGALNWQVRCCVLRQYVRLIWWYLLEKKREGNIWQTADLEQLLVGVGGRNSDSSCCFKLVSYRGIDTKWGGSNDRLAIGTCTWEGKNVIKHETVL